MIKHKTKTYTEKIIDTIQCDVCGKEYDSQLEWQEFFFVKHQCGYKSVFGDQSSFELDICQYCFKEKFKTFIKIKNDYEGE